MTNKYANTGLNRDAEEMVVYRELYEFAEETNIPIYEEDMPDQARTMNKINNREWEYDEDET